MPKSKRKSKGDTNKLEEAEIERYFLNPNAVSKHLYCSICQEVFQEPQRAPCGHSYCFKCIDEWLKRNRSCPDDRKPLQKSQLHKDFILENIIGDQMVACPFRKHGCDNVGQLDRLKIHVSLCDFNPKNLPDFLKEDLQKSTERAASVRSTQGGLDIDVVSDDDEVIPALEKPSLKMRLFQGDTEKRQILCSMFDENDKEPEKKKPKK